MVLTRSISLLLLVLTIDIVDQPGHHSLIQVMNGDKVVATKEFDPDHYSQSELDSWIDSLNQILIKER